MSYEEDQDLPIMRWMREMRTDPGKWERVSQRALRLSLKPDLTDEDRLILAVVRKMLIDTSPVPRNPEQKEWMREMRDDPEKWQSMNQAALELSQKPDPTDLDRLTLADMQALVAATAPE